MAQESFFSDDLGVDTSIDVREVEAFMNDTAAPTADPKDVKPAPAEKSEDKKPAEPDPKQKEAEEQAKKDKEDIEAYLNGDESGDKKPEKKEDKKPDTAETPELEGIQELASDLFKANIWTKDEDETDDDLPETTEEFIERFQWEKQKVAEQMVYNLLGRHGEEYRAALEAILVQGVHPQQYLSQFEKVQSFKGLDMTDEGNQERVVIEALKAQDWEPEDIKDEVKKLKLNSDLETTAQRYHKALVKTEEQRTVRMQEEAKVAAEQKKAAAAQEAQNIRTILQEAAKKQELDGIPVTRDEVPKVLNFLENKNWVLGDQKLSDYECAILELNRPQNHAEKVKLAALIRKSLGDQGLQPGKPIKLDFGPVERKAVSKESSELFQGIRGKKVQKGTTTTEGKKPEMADFLSGL